MRTWRRWDEPWEEFSFLLNKVHRKTSPWRLGLSGARESALVECPSLLGASGALITARENPRDRAAMCSLTPGRTHNRIRSPR